MLAKYTDKVFIRSNSGGALWPHEWSILSHKAKHPHASLSGGRFPTFEQLAPVHRTMRTLPFSPVSREKAHLREMAALRLGCS